MNVILHKKWELTVLVGSVKDSKTGISSGWSKSLSNPQTNSESLSAIFGNWTKWIRRWTRSLLLRDGSKQLVAYYDDLVYPYNTYTPLASLDLQRVSLINWLVHFANRTLRSSCHLKSSRQKPKNEEISWRRIVRILNSAKLVFWEFGKTRLEPWKVATMINRVSIWVFQ